MSGWSDPDVTPVGGVPGARAERAPAPGGGAAFAPGDDPFGSRPSVRRRGWIRIVLGVALMIAGVAFAVSGILEAIDSGGRIESDAVGRGTIRDGGRADAVAFEVPEGGRRDYSVYVLFSGGLVRNDANDDLTVRDTGCLATMPDGVQTRFRGARQGMAQTIGNAATVGYFSSLPGRVVVSCAYTSSSRRSRRTRPDTIAWVVTPGRPDFLGGGVIAIVGGVTGALAGGFLFGWGWRGRWRTR